MKSIILPNGLTLRTANNLKKAGVPINKRAVIKAIKDGTLYPHCVSRHYGIETHRQVCVWAGVNPRGPWRGPS
jgi:hypothetical protein